MKTAHAESDHWLTEVSTVHSDWLWLSGASGRGLSHRPLPAAFNWSCWEIKPGTFFVPSRCSSRMIDLPPHGKRRVKIDVLTSILDFRLLFLSLSKKGSCACVCRSRKEQESRYRKKWGLQSEDFKYLSDLQKLMPSHKFCWSLRSYWSLALFSFLDGEDYLFYYAAIMFFS